MQKFLLLLLVSCFNVADAQMMDSFDDPVKYVSTLVGSDSKYDVSNGNTYPAIAMPWGMNFWTAQTEKAGEAFIYSYQADRIRGFKQTHQASNWIGDYGQFTIMPGVGKVKFAEDDRASLFTHKSEIAQPHYYKVHLAEPGVTVEITPTERAAILQFTFPATDSAYIVIDALDMGSEVHFDKQSNSLKGYSTKNKGSVPANFRNYFVMTFSKQVASVSVFDKEKLLAGQVSQSGEHAGFVAGFATARNEKVQVKVASSFISHEQALRNMEEIGDADFETIRERGRAAWNKELGRIKIGGATVDQARTFYSCLYRCLLFPRKFFETDGTGNIVHYSPFNGRIEKGYMFTDNGYFDTYRALFPFFSVMYPDLYAQILEGMANAYKESGWLPEWTSPGHHAHVTFGSYSAAIISDAYIKGIRGYDIETLYKAILKNTVNEPPPKIRSVGRLGVEYYNRLGFVPYDAGVKENTSRTLEYAYLDFTIAQLAKALNRPSKEIELFAKRSFNYRHHFDPATGLMRPKSSAGSFLPSFNPFRWGDAFTEGNSWHYTWATVNDVQGLINLMGGRNSFVEKLDSVFILPPVYDESWYGKVIHEIKEMLLADMGQYVHANQPMQHVVYLFNYAGTPWKTQYWVREIMDRLYNAGPAGYCGDEDTGQTSAWYIFSALGFYPVTPGTDQYVLGAPLFRRAVLELANGKQVEINAPANDKNKRYIDKMFLNGKEYSKNWVSHSELMKGAKIDVSMSITPNINRGTSTSAFPFSQSSVEK